MPSADVGTARIYRWLPRAAVLLAMLVYWLAVAGGDPTQQSLWIALAVFAASVVSSVAGFAFSAICGAMLLHLVDDPVHGVQIMMVCSIAGQSMMVWSLRRDIDWRQVSVFLAGAAFGLPLGVMALLALKAKFGIAIGLLVILYAVIMLVRPSGRLRVQNPLLDALVGFLGGITGGAAAFPGAFVTIWCGLKGWSKERQRALYQPFILIAQIAALVLLQAMSASSGKPLGVGLDSLTCVPAMLLGTVLGLAFFRRLNDRQFQIAVNLLLIVSGASLVV
jgi:hypothetical protein